MGCNGGLPIPYSGPYIFYPTQIYTKDFFQNHKFYDKNGQIVFKKLHRKRGHDHYLNLWNYCFREVLTPKDFYGPEYRLKSLSNLNTNLKIIETLCSTSHRFNYDPLKQASRSKLNALADKYSRNAMLQMEQIREIVEVASGIFDQEEEDTIRHRFYKLISEDIERLYLRLQEISQSNDLSVSDVKILETYKGPIEKLQGSLFWDKHEKISALFNVCAIKMEQHKIVEKEKQARQEAISLKARNLISYLEGPKILLNFPFLEKMMANIKPSEIPLEKKQEIEETLNSPDLENHLKYTLSDLYDAHLQKLTDYYMDQLSTLNESYVFHYPHFLESWLIDAHDISEESAKVTLSGSEIGDKTFTTFLENKSRCIKELEEYFYRLNLNKATHATFLMDLLDAKNIKTLETIDQSQENFDESHFKALEDSSDIQCRILLDNVREFRNKLNSIIYNSDWEGQLDQLRQKAKSQAKLDNGINKLNRSLVLEIARLQLMIEERSFFNDIWSSARKIQNTNPDEKSTYNSIIDTFIKQKFCLPSTLRKLNQIDELSDSLSQNKI